jgi:hypothetical protein
MKYGKKYDGLNEMSLYVKTTFLHGDLEDNVPTWVHGRRNLHEKT